MFVLTECGVRGGLCLGSKETKDRGIVFFFEQSEGVMVGFWQLGYLCITGSQRKENFTALTHGYLVTLSSSIVIVLGIVLKPPIHSSYRAKSTTAKALRIQRNA